MYNNLKTALRQKGITNKQYGELLGVAEKTVTNKLSGITDFTYPEFKKTCSIFPEYKADYLFAEHLESA
jgi:transcriptional regulator with XRE-family HTH domain